MAKHLVDLDEDALSAAKAELGTRTLRDTVNQALRLAGALRDPKITKALDALSTSKLRDRGATWR